MSSRFRKSLRCRDNLGNPTTLDVQVTDTGEVVVNPTPNSPARMTLHQVTRFVGMLREAHTVAAKMNS